MGRGIWKVCLCSLFILLLCACGRDGATGSNPSAGGGQGISDGGGAQAVGDSPSVPAEGSWIQGIYLKGRQSHLLVRDWDVLVLYAADETVSFEGLTDGDVVNVYLDYVLETWPGQTTVYAVEKLEDGSLQDISPEVSGQLRENGWLE